MRTVILAWGILFSTLVFSEEVLTLGSDEWMPYAEANSKSGFMVEVAIQAFQSQGISINFLEMPWPRVLEKVRSGELSAAIGLQKNQAEDFIFHDEPLGVDEASFFVWKNDPWKYSGVESIRERVLGVIQDYSYEKEIDLYIKENLNGQKVHKVHGGHPYEKLIQMLYYKRLSLIIANPFVFRYNLKKLNISSDFFREIPIKESKKFVYIGFSPKNKNSQKYAQILSDGIVKLRICGAFAQILAKYEMIDWVPEVKTKRTNKTAPRSTKMNIIRS